ncbi:hypothetical protein J5Y09_15315 [Roseomonas sp. PWR1]|uniref:DUF4136 domain-containing protein n=1 Tax=Roseomonas nitratireducens TaxID=2820810 RepID=A0ABS4AV98_9PROT|nr:hypothetical protein [Neoroseomonas nitratireducens]MBP0465293.1 hypothetical protein [Neoroseomonas nitratireducens]
MRGIAIRFITAAVLAACAAPAFAQDTCPGRLSANAFAPVPRTAAIAVPDRAQSENERRMRAAVLGALATSGRRVAADAPYILSWRGGVSTEGDNFGGFADTMQDRTFREGDDLSWAHDAPRMGGRRVASVRVSGVVELRDRASGRVVWTAVLSCTRHGTDDEALFAHLANAVAPWIGQAVAGRPF